MSRLEPRPLSRGPSAPERGERPTDAAGDDRGNTRGADGDWLRPADESPLADYLPERWRGARFSPGRAGVGALCCVGVVVVVVAGFSFLRDTPVAAPVPTLPVVQPVSVEPASSSSAAEVPAEIVVSVVGLVARSGLVRLPPGSRVADALDAAGGPIGAAHVLALNLAARLNDGDQIVVGSTPPEGAPVVSGTVQDSGASPGASATPGAAGSPSASASAVAVNLNSATVAELDALNGVGPVTAAAIVAWREVNGPFTDVGQLAEVDGIGPVRFEKLRGQVTV